MSDEQQEGFTPEDMQQIAAIVKRLKAEKAAKERPANWPQGQEINTDHSAELRQSFGDGISHAAKTLRIDNLDDALLSAGKGLVDFVKGSDVPLPIATAPSQRDAQGRELRKYSDGKYYPAGTDFKKLAAQQPPKPQVVAGHRFPKNGWIYEVQPDGSSIPIEKAR